MDDFNFDTVYGFIPFADLVEGEQYQYNNAYHACGDVTILETNTQPDDEDWVGVKVRVDKVLFGKSSMEVGDEFEVGYRKGYEHYNKIKFKEVDSFPDYYHPELNDLPEEDRKKFLPNFNQDD